MLYHFYIFHYGKKSAVFLTFIRPNWLFQQHKYLTNCLIYDSHSLRVLSIGRDLRTLFHIVSIYCLFYQISFRSLWTWTKLRHSFGNYKNFELINWKTKKSSRRMKTFVDLFTGNYLSERYLLCCKRNDHIFSLSCFCLLWHVVDVRENVFWIFDWFRLIGDKEHF